MRLPSPVLVRLLVAATALGAVAGVDSREEPRAVPYVRAVSMAKDLRAAPELFAQQAGLDPAEFRARYGATGLIRCGQAVGSGQLTLESDIITTAGHVFFAKGGELRAKTCAFEPTAQPGRNIAIDMNSIVAGAADPMTERATRDWAVARLSETLPEAVPYTLGANVGVPSGVLMYGGGNGNAATLGAERCSARRFTAQEPDGIREFSFDCSAAHGGSGAALLNENDQVVGIFVGYRSIDPEKAMPFSDRHYNFGITVDGPFREALMRLAGKNVH